MFLSERLLCYKNIRNIQVMKIAVLYYKFHIDRSVNQEILSRSAVHELSVYILSFDFSSERFCVHLCKVLISDEDDARTLFMDK